MTSLAAPIETIDDRFKAVAIGNARVDHLWTGARWTEGPVYVPAWRSLLFSDIPNDRVMRFDEITGETTEFERPALNANGHALDLAGRVVSCEHRGRAISRIGHDGRRQVLADRVDGKRLNSPNDVVVKSDGSVWFTDPTYGIDSDYEGDAADSEIGAAYVYRIDPDGTIAAVVTDMAKPNGLAFSADESLLYVSETGTSHHGPSCPPVIRTYPVAPDGRSVLADERSVFATCTVGVFDGFRVDVHDNVWTSAGDGVHCHAPDGTLIGKIHIPEVVANVEFGGPKRNRLYMCGTSSLYAIYVNTKAATAALLR